MTRRSSNDNFKLTKRQKTQIINHCIDRMISDVEEMTATIKKTIEYCTKKK